MSDFDWSERVADVIRRMEARGREEFIDMIDDVVDGLDAQAIVAKRGVREKVLATALTDVTAIVHNSRPLPELGQGGWFASVGETFEVAPGFATAWRAARQGGGSA